MAKKAKLPKKIAGYKIPKAIRRNSKPVIALLQTKQAQALIGAAIAAAIAALAQANAETVDDAGKKVKAKGKRAMLGLESLAEHGMNRATRLAEALGRTVASAVGDHGPEPTKARPAKKAKDTKAAKAAKAQAATQH